jgi:RNA polymerase sigma-70 factor (ECF subfamily)
MIAPARIQFLKERIARFNDQQAYRELYMAFFPPLLQFANGFIKSRQSAEEIVSDVFITIWEKRNRLEHISNLKLYLYTATRNTAINYITRHNKVMITELSELPIEPQSLHYDPERMLITSEMKKMIAEAINSLPTRCKLIFKLVKEDELKYREVAELLKVSIKTVETQMSIALKRIGEAIRFDPRKTLPTGKR